MNWKKDVRSPCVKQLTQTNRVHVVTSLAPTTESFAAKQPTSHAKLVNLVKKHLKVYILDSYFLTFLLCFSRFSS